MVSNFLKQMRTETLRRVAIYKKSTSLYKARKSARIPHKFVDVFSRRDIMSVIAEIKFASPSAGQINTRGNTLEIAEQFLSNGAQALSILTESNYFKGSMENLSQVRQKFPSARLLMKDFFIDEVQLLQAHALGADAVLLIAAFLSPAELSLLYTKAVDLGLTPLVEVFTVEELRRAEALGAGLIGVNSRNLHNFNTDLTVAKQLIGESRSSATLLALSGINSGQQMQELRLLGYQGFLIGSHLMANENPGTALKTLLMEAGHDKG